VIPANSKPAYKISFEPVTIIRDSNKIIIDIHAAIGVDRKGRIYIQEDRYTINVFSPQGHYITHFGRRGRGPGEFENVLKMTIRSEKLYIYDNTTSRIDIFTLDPPSFSHAIVISPDRWMYHKSLRQFRLYNFFVRNNGTFLYQFQKPVINAKYDRYYLADSTGKVISGQIFKRRHVNITNGFGAGQSLSMTIVSKPTIPSTRNSLMAVSPDGHIFSAWSQNFLIKEYSPKGKYLKAIFHPFKNAPINRTKFMKRYKDKSARLRNAVRKELQDTWPALSYTLLDSQNRLWVSTISKDPNHYQWWVISPSGKLLAKFKWPGKRKKRDYSPRHIRVIKNGFLYDMKKDKTTGRDELVKYRIIMKSNADKLK